MTLHIDGTAEDGTFQGGDPRKDNLTAPWTVFDDEAQKNVAGPFRWRWQAVLMRWALLAGESMANTDLIH